MEKTMTREKMIEFIKANPGVKITHELFSADEVLVTSSTKLLRSVSLIDNIPVGGRNKELIHTIRRELNKDYFLFVK